jgi:flagellar hook assembly protein FlgD
MDVEIQIFDKLGRLVKVLSTKIKDPGFRIADSELKWNGTNDNNGRLANGIYSYRLVVKTNNSQNAVKSGKVVFLR